MIAKTFGKIWQSFLHDTLFRNSIYLMLNTGLMGLFGFVFWTISTHLFTPEEIGLGTTMISSMTLISYIGLLGFNNTFIRFLPTSANRNRDINAGVIIVSIVSIITGILYIILIPFITPSLSILHSNIFFGIIFIGAVVLLAINSLTDSIFIAYRAAQFALITDGIIISISKLLFPAFLSDKGAPGVFMSFALATFLGLFFSMLILRFKFQFRPKIQIDLENTRKVLAYSFTSYLGSLFAISPTLLLPLIIITSLGSAEAGYFYLALMLLNLLYAVATSVSQSLFAEGSYGEIKLLPLLKQSSKILGFILIPGSIIFALFGPLVFQLFGKSYSSGTAEIIVILALSSPLVAMFTLGSTLLKIRNQMYSLIFVNALQATTVCGLAILWAGRGLVWVSYAWIIGHLVAGLVAFILIYKYRHLPTTPKELKS